MKRLTLKLAVIVVFFVLPAVPMSTYANDTKAPPAADSAGAITTPVKFLQQLGKGTKPAWQRLIPSYAERSPLPVEGKAMYYNPGIMQRVIAYRLNLHQIDVCVDCIGYVALLRAGDINRKIWLQVNADTVEGPFLVTDAAARHHIPRLLRIGWGVDVDWQTAERWQMKMPMVTILDTPPEGMIINSTAAWRSELQPKAQQFNEIAPLDIQVEIERTR